MSEEILKQVESAEVEEGPAEDSIEYPPETGRMLSWRALSIVHAPLPVWFKPALFGMVFLIVLSALTLNFVSVPNREKSAGTVRVVSKTAHLEFSLPDVLAKDVRVGDVLTAQLELMSEPFKFEVRIVRLAGRNADRNLQFVAVPVSQEIVDRWIAEFDRFDGAVAEVSVSGPKSSLLQLLIGQ